MMQYLGIIEMRTNEILQMYAACQSKTGLDPQASATPQNPTAVKDRDKDKIEFEPPNTQDKDIEDLEDCYEKLPPHELKERARKAISENFDKMVKKKGPKTTGKDAK